MDISVDRMAAIGTTMEQLESVYVPNGLCMTAVVIEEEASGEGIIIQFDDTGAPYISTEAP